MLNGLVVIVRTKYYGQVRGVVVQTDEDGCLVQPIDSHPRKIIALFEDITFIGR